MLFEVLFVGAAAVGIKKLVLEPLWPKTKVYDHERIRAIEESIRWQKAHPQAARAPYRQGMSVDEMIRTGHLPADYRR